jgi:hypothetical protein
MQLAPKTSELAKVEESNKVAGNEIESLCLDEVRR